MRRAEPGRFGGILLTLLKLILIQDQPIDAFLQQPLLVAQVEIHGFLSSLPSWIGLAFHPCIVRMLTAMARSSRAMTEAE